MSFNEIKRYKDLLSSEVKVYFVASIMFGFLSFCIESSFILVFQGFLVSIGLISENLTFLPHWYPVSILPSVVALLIFGILRASAIVLKNHSSELAKMSFVCDQRKFLFAYGLNNAHAVSSKEIISTFSEVVSQSGLSIGYVSVIINTSITSFFLFILGLILAPAEMLIATTLLFLLLLPLRYYSNQINSSGRGIFNEWENLNDSLLKGLKNNFFLKIYKLVDSAVSSGFDSIDKYKNHYLRYSIIAGISSGLPLVAGVIIMCIVAFISVTYLKTDPIKLVSFFYIFIRLAQAASETRTNLLNVKINAAGFNKLDSLKKMTIESSHINLKEIYIDKISSIDIVDLTFGFNNKNYLLTNLNISLVTGDVLTIKGESGSGKSTLLSIILGINNPTSGKILINDLDCNKNLLNFHNSLAYVGPEPYLINGTVKENLTYGHATPDLISEDDLWDSLTAVDLANFVKKLPQKLNEQILDIAQMSTGQKQRLSFSRALLRNPSLIVLDEATANLDSLTESKIISYLNQISKDKILIIVTHKNSFDSIATNEVIIK